MTIDSTGRGVRFCSGAAGDFLAVLKQRRLINDMPPGLVNRSEFKETVARG
jgi:hypothetical protein